MSALTLITAPTVEPLTTAEAKTHLRVTASDDDTYISNLILSARKLTEEITNRALINQTWDYFIDYFPKNDFISFPKANISSVTYVKYTDKDLSEATLAASEYFVDTDSLPGRLVLNYGKTWPSFTPKPVNAVRIRFVAGYGAAATAVPEGIKQAMLLMILHWYENREAVSEAKLDYTPFAIEHLLWPERVKTF